MAVVKLAENDFILLFSIYSFSILFGVYVTSSQPFLLLTCQDELKALSPCLIWWS